MNRFADEVYREHGAAVLRLATRLCRGDRGLAEDVLQGTVTRAWRHAAELRASDRHLRPWLFTLARRIAMNQARARRARPPEAGEAYQTVHAALASRLALVQAQMDPARSTDADDYAGAA